MSEPKDDGPVEQLSEIGRGMLDAPSDFGNALIDGIFGSSTPKDSEPDEDE